MQMVSDPLIQTLLQTGALGVVVYMLLTQINVSLKELAAQIAKQNADLAILLDRNVRAMEQVAREATASREAVVTAVQESHNPQQRTA